MIYLVCPYTHGNLAVEETRAHAASRAAAELMKRGEVVFSPISHGHAIRSAADGDIGGTFDVWQRIDAEVLKVCSRVVVLMLEGWDRSRGVRREIVIAREYKIPIELLEPDGSGRIAYGDGPGESAAGPGLERDHRGPRAADRRGREIGTRAGATAGALFLWLFLRALRLVDRIIPGLSGVLVRRARDRRLKGL